jgi:hypothetical protein
VNSTPTSQQIAGDVGTLAVCLAETVLGRVELREIVGALAQRIGGRDAMASRAMRVDQAQHPRVTRGKLRRHLSRQFERLWLCSAGPRDARAGVRRVLFLEVIQPARVHGAGIDLPTLADFGHQLGVDPERVDGLAGGIRSGVRPVPVA